MSFGGGDRLNGMTSQTTLTLAGRTFDQPSYSQTLPPDVAIMLDAPTRRFFDDLPYGQKRHYVEPIVRAKEPVTREHRIAHAIRKLRDRRAR